MLNNKVIKLWVGLFLAASTAFAQDTLPKKFAVSGGFHYGFLIAHRPMVVPLQQNKIKGIETSFLVQTNGSKEWHHVYGFPRIGISFSMWDLGNPEQLGNSFTLIPYVDFPIVKGKKSALDLKFGWGMGYVEKTFNADDNYKNIAVGSKLNFSLILQPHYKIKISDNFEAGAGISLTHYSNGSVATPNLGLNIASLTANITYNFGQELALQKKEMTSFKKSSRYSIFIAASSKQIYPADGKNYFASTLSANKAWQIAKKSAFGVGADFFYDESIYTKLENDTEEPAESIEAFRGGVHGSYELVIDDLSFIFNMGAYLYSAIDDGIFYHRIGLRYAFTNNLFTCMHIKAHWGKADYTEWGIGYKFGK